MRAPDGPILITGGSGFVGGRLTRALLRAWPQAGIAWFSREAAAGNPLEAPPAPLSVMVGDLCSPDAIDGVVKALQPRLVLHLAAQSSVADSARAPFETWNSNFFGSCNLARSLARHAPAASFIFASSADVYGRAFGSGDVTEDTPAQPLNAYGRSKLAAERMLADLLPRASRLIVMRPTNHTGPGHDERFALPSFAAQIARIEAGLAPPTLRIGNLDVARDFLDVDDVVDAYLAVIGAGEALPLRATYNIGSGRPIVLRALLDKMRAQARVPVEVKVDPARYRDADFPRTCVIANRLSQATGWSPRRSLDGTIARMLDFWRERCRGDAAGR